MKTKLSRSLSLKKETIVHLTEKHLKSAVGGAVRIDTAQCTLQTDNSVISCDGRNACTDNTSFGCV